MEHKIKILLAEDDFEVGDALKNSILVAGYQVDHIFDGETAVRAYRKYPYHICLLDVSMPRVDGFEACKRIRKKSDLVPIILMANSPVVDQDKIIALKAGADAVITKPLNIQLLLLRIEVFLKRLQWPGKTNTNIFALGNSFFDYSKMQFQDNHGREIKKFTPLEANLLRFLCENADKAIKRDELLRHVWGKDDFYLGRSMDVVISTIRKCLAGESTVWIETLHGVGFRLHTKKT